MDTDSSRDPIHEALVEAAGAMHLYGNRAAYIVISAMIQANEVGRLGELAAEFGRARVALACDRLAGRIGA